MYLIYHPILVQIHWLSLKVWTAQTTSALVTLALVTSTKSTSEINTFENLHVLVERGHAICIWNSPPLFTFKSIATRLHGTMVAIEFVFTLIRRIGQVVKKVVETKKKILHPQTDFVVIFSMETCGLKK